MIKKLLLPLLLVAASGSAFSAQFAQFSKETMICSSQFYAEGMTRIMRLDDFESYKVLMQKKKCAIVDSKVLDGVCRLVEVKGEHSKLSCLGSNVWVFNRFIDNLNELE